VELEKAVLALARRQFGVVSAEQCVAKGFSRNSIQNRLDRGLWLRLGWGVYAPGAAQATADQRAMAALLAAGDDACLSHHSAAQREGISVPRVSRLHVRVPWAQKRRAPVGVVYWRSRSLDPGDVMHRQALRLTRVGRTMLDLSTVLTRVELRVALDSALRARRKNLHWIRLLLEREGNGRSGAKMLRELLHEYSSDGEVSDSDLESFAMELGLATARKPSLHYEVFQGTELVAEVDLAWPRVRMVVELDGWLIHGSKEAFQTDRTRDRRLALLGWQVLRYTWRDVQDTPDRFIREISTLYELRLSSVPGPSASGLVGP
jgi:hypothetical protein